MSSSILSRRRVGIICLILLACCAVLWWRGVPQQWGLFRPRAPKEVRVFWERFALTNSAWLNPSPPALTYEIDLQQKDLDRTSKEFWSDSGLLQTWCTPEQNIRLVEQRCDVKGSVRSTVEHRYFHGRGDEVRIPSQGKLRQVAPASWLAARIGTGFLTPLHLVSLHGLPPKTTVQKAADGTFLLQVREWRGIHRTGSDGHLAPSCYGVHPDIFSSCMELYSERFEVEVDAQTFHPRRLRELDTAGRVLADITFSGPWLPCQGQVAPSIIRCNLPGQGRNLTYRFTNDQGLWLLKELDSEVPGSYSLCYRSAVRQVKLGPLPDSLFPSPADHTLPERSFTTMLPGERIVSIPTSDGLTLEGKLTLPPTATGPVPVVFFLAGAGLWTFDRPVVYPDLQQLKEMFPPMKVTNYCDSLAREAVARNCGFFRMNKRGCAIIRNEEGRPQEIVNRSLFARATPSVLLTDYEAALRALRSQPGVDAQRIILMGASEGTRLAPRLALRSPDGISGLALFGYSAYAARETLEWQFTVGPWRNTARIFDADTNGVVTRAEYDQAVARVGHLLADAMPFDRLDRNNDGKIIPSELAQRPHVKAIFKAVRERDDDCLWDNVVNLSSAYLLDDWEGEPTSRQLVQLTVPIGIFHGDLDGSCRVEGVQETEGAFRRANKTNLTVRTYPRTDHDLNWGQLLKTGQTPAGFVEMFDYIGRIAQSPNGR